MFSERLAVGSWQRWIVLLCVVFVGIILVQGSRAEAAVYDREELALVRLINEHRAAYGLDPLLISDTMSKATTRHNLDMGRYWFVSHSSLRSDYFPNGYLFWQRLAAMGYGGASSGENLAAGVPLMSADAAFAAWRDSEGHNAQMLSSEYKAIGVSSDLVPGSEYGLYWTADFGSYVDQTAHTVDASGTRSVMTGADRYATAILVTKKAFPDGAPVAVVVKGDDFPDALAAAPLAFAYGGPVVLTPSTGLTSAVRSELQRLSPKTVFVIGLPDSLGDGVEAALPHALVKVIRGKDRYDTAAQIAARLKDRLGSVEKVVLVPGDNFPDALAVAPLAAKNGWAILLTPQYKAVPQVTTQAILDSGAPTALVVGTRASPPIPAEYRVGTDRYHTSVLVATYAAEHGMSFNHVALATGEKFPDALVMGPYLAQDGAIMLLTRPSGLPATVSSELSARRATVRQLDMVGLSGIVLSTVKMALQ